jgi:hypothetical protein
MFLSRVSTNTRDTALLVSPDQQYLPIWVIHRLIFGEIPLGLFFPPYYYVSFYYETIDLLRFLVYDKVDLMYSSYHVGRIHWVYVIFLLIMFVITMTE